MLVLTRRTNESIVIGNDVVITVLEVRNDQVRIGIKAPRSVQVHREEVYQQISRENAAAVASADRAKTLLRRVPPGVFPSSPPAHSPSPPAPSPPAPSPPAPSPPAPSPPAPSPPAHGGE